MDHFFLPLLLNGFQQVSSYFPHSSLEGADLHRVIASGGAALQLPEDVATTSFRIGDQPGQDLLSISLKGVFLGTPPAQHAFSPLLLSVQGMVRRYRIGNAPLDRNVSCCTTSHRKETNKCRW